MKKPFFALGVLALVGSGIFASVASGADHRDSPSNLADIPADATDIYAFRSPANANNLVVALNINPLIAPSDNATRGKFDPNLSYTIEIDRNGDVQPEATVMIRMTTNPDQLVVEGLGDPLTVPITAPDQAAVITRAGAISAFAGLREDPFFFDLTGFQGFVANPRPPVSGLRPAGGGTASDTFAGTNILSIVLEIPVAAATGGTSANAGTIKVVSNIFRNGVVKDRIAIPAVNTALVPAAQKDAFNAATNESADVATFGAGVTSTITALRGAVDGLLGGPTTQDGGPLGSLTPAQLTAALLPYVVTIDFSKPVQFPNGRRLQDDVIDAALGLTVNRGGPAGFSDGVNANDRPFLTAFPYLAEPFTPAAPAPAATTAPSGAVRPPSTGDGGLFEDATTMWTLSAGLFLLAITFGGAGVMAAFRSRSR